VHLASLGHPLLGDATYGRRSAAGAADPALAALIEGLDGVALHAAGLAFLHPTTGEAVELEAPLPVRMERLLAHLRAPGRR
jgi:23S rRNA pseudouridine1911/1915/1917 synthase